MADTWISDVGIRVTNLARSLEFYRTIFDLEILKRVEDSDRAYVLLRDRRSGQRLELNWYADDNPFAAPYVPGEGLDHIEVRVRDVPQMMERLRALGILPATRKLWTNKRVVQRLRKNPESKREMEQEMWTTRSGHRVVYIQDPDGLFLALYDHPEEPWEGPIPDHY